MKLLIQSPVDHDGVAYKEGEMLTIKNEDQAQALVIAGVAVEVLEDAKKSKAKDE